MEKQGLFHAMHVIRAMVNDFINTHERDWEKVNEEYKAQHGFYMGPQSLSLQSYIGSDLLIDFIYLTKEVEEKVPFTNEYWIRSMGTQCIRTEQDKENNDVFTDVLAKISVTYNGEEFTDIHWVEDEKCLIHNRLLEEGKLFNFAY